MQETQFDIDPGSIIPLVDVTDLVSFIGCHDSLTGIQRVAASIVISLLDLSPAALFVSFAAVLGRFVKLDRQVLTLVLREATLPPHERAFHYDRAQASCGLLPGFDEIRSDHRLVESVYAVLISGTPWVTVDYFRHLDGLRDTFDARLACVIHDLVPIYAADTCHKGTVEAFRQFLWETRNITNIYICVSKNTEADLIRYFDVNGWPRPRTVVVRHATTKLVVGTPSRPSWFPDDTRGHVLLVSTIEARKNHTFAFNLWRRLLASHADDLPRLICVGRLGWRSDQFLFDYLATDGLSGCVDIRSNVPDQELTYLYETARFTLYPSLYEGWGLPISESLAYGKLCVCSNTSSMPEAGGDLAIYIDPRNLSAASATISELLDSPEMIDAAQRKIKTSYRARTWSEVAHEYLAALETCAREKTKSNLPPLPTCCTFRRRKSEFGDAVGDALLARIEEHLRSDLRTGFLQASDFEDGRTARRSGDWQIQEDWGCWVGLRGASLCFAASQAGHYTLQFSYITLDPFKGSWMEIRVNGTPTYHLMTSDRHGVVTVEAAVVQGKNVVTFDGHPTREQTEWSLGIDPRGLMIGLKEMVCEALDPARESTNVGPPAFSRMAKHSSHHGQSSAGFGEDSRPIMWTDDDEIVGHAFAAGTLVLTARGEIPIEQVAPGDLVTTYTGLQRPVRKVVGGAAEGGRAIRIPAEAVSSGKPTRDLYVTADQDVCLKVVSECILPVAELAHKSTFEEIRADSMTFWHLVLDEDDVCFFAGLPMTSGQATGHLGFDRIDDRRLIEMIRATLRLRAPSLGWRLEKTPPLNLHIIADGVRIEASVVDLSFRFLVPASASDVWLVSECSVPKEVGFNADGRLLGACVGEIRVEDGLRVSRPIPLDDPSLEAGFHNFEGSQRWTDGCAKLSPVFWRECVDIFFLTVKLTMPALPRFLPPPSEQDATKR